jgi:GH35 family endo-1,4-beta-xylanase
MLVAMLMASALSSAALAATTLNGGDIRYRSAGAPHDTTGWVLTEEGYLGTFIELQSPETITVTVRAEGEMADGVLPIMDLHVADFKASWHVSDHGGAHTDYDEYVASFDLPAGTHSVRIEYVNDHTTTGDRNLYVADATFEGSTLTALNTESEANSLAASQTYYDNYRLGPATVTIYNSSGTPIAASTTVDVDLKRHSFIFGTTIYGLDMSHYGWVDPNPTPGTDEYEYQQFQTQHFNAISIENAGKWLYNEEVRDVVTMDFVDAIFDYAELHELYVRLHSCVWDFDAQEPDWVNTMQTQAVTDPVVAQEYRDEISERIQYYVADRADRYIDLDGINETLHNPINTDIFGLSGVAGIYNDIAAASAERANVFVNEWGVVSTQSPSYSKWFRDHVQDLIDAGAHIDGIGIQGHMYLGWDDVPTAYRVLQNIAGFERIMRITEFSFDDAETGDIAGKMINLIKLAFGNDQCHGFTTWGFWSEAMWRNGAALVDANWDVTPAGTAWLNLMSTWDTNETRATDSQGSVDFTGYYGDYAITVNGTPHRMTLNKGISDYHVFIGDTGAPSAPTDLTARNVTTSSIDWAWQDESNDETGFDVFAEAGTGPPMTAGASRPVDAEDFPQTGLAANSPYAVQVAAVNANGHSDRTDNIVARTLPLPPVYSDTGDCAITSDTGAGSASDRFFPNSIFTFTAVNGLGDGPTKAASYRYAWGQSPTEPIQWRIQPTWAQGDLVVPATTTGDYYLHLRALNADGKENTTTLTLGPYPVVDQTPDFDKDGDVDARDFGHLQACLSGSGIDQPQPSCQDGKLDSDSDIDPADIEIFVSCLSGPNATPEANCMNE